MIRKSIRFRLRGKREGMDVKSVTHLHAKERDGGEQIDGGLQVLHALDTRRRKIVLKTKCSERTNNVDDLLDRGTDRCEWNCAADREV